MTATRRVRPARSEDLDALVEVGRRSWLSAFAETAPFALIAWWARTDRTRTLYEANWSRMFVLDEEGAILGLMQPNDDEINGLWIHPKWQGTGAGTRLLEHGEALVRGAGHSVVWLTCSAFNPRALDFYRRRGYVEVRRDLEQHASGVEIENIRMELRLDAAPARTRGG